MADLDDLLDSVLDEFDEEQEEVSAAPKTFEDGLEDAMKMIGEDAREIRDGAVDEDEFLNKLMQQMEGLDADPENEEAMDQFVQSMMQEMFTGEALLPPIEQIVSLYPAWLEKNSHVEEIDRYHQQFACFQEIHTQLKAHGPGPVPEQVISLMTQVQEFGNPPEEVLGEMLPGAPFGAEPTDPECASM